MKLTLDEIQTWQEFEDLVSDYFRGIEEVKENNLIEVRVEPSGIGSDRGRDIFLTFRLDDSITIHEIKWIVQCKFKEKPLSKSDLRDVNIPTLIHEYNANGYLLVCKGRLTSGLTEMFENLRKNCKFKYAYEFWEGNQFVNKLKVRPELFSKFFPKYYEYLEKIKNTKNLS